MSKLLSFHRKNILWGLPILLVVLGIILLFLRADYVSAQVGWTTHTNLPANWLSDMEINMAGGEWDGPINGVRVFDGEAWVINEFLPVEFTDSTGRSWSITFSGLTFVNGNKEIYYRNEYVNAFALDSLGRPWIATSFRGVQVLAPDGSRRIYSRDSSGLHTRRIDEILIDPSGNIWFYDRSTKSASKLVLEGDYLPDSFNIELLRFVVSLLAGTCLVAILFYTLWEMKLIGKVWIVIIAFPLGLFVAGTVFAGLGWNEMSWLFGTLLYGFSFGWMMAIFLENNRYRFQIEPEKGSRWIHETRNILGLIIISIGIVVAGMVAEYFLDRVWSNEIFWMEEATAFIISLATGLIPVKISLLLLPRI